MEAGSSKLKRQIWLLETAEMIIKGDLDRMAEDIGHAGKSWYAVQRQEEGKDDISIYTYSTLCVPSEENFPWIVEVILHHIAFYFVFIPI